MKTKLLTLLVILTSIASKGQTWFNAYSIGSTTNSINDKSYGACTDGAGNKYFAGNFTGTSDFDPTSGVNNLVSVAAGSGYNCYLTKYGQAGEFLYAVKFGLSTNYSSMNIGCICTDGTYVYVYGTYQGAATFGAYTLTSGLSENNLFICKFLASDGSVVWAQSYGGTNYELPFSICTDNSGGLYINGTFNASTTFGTFSLSCYITDGFTAKVNASDGSVAWITQYGTTNGYSEGQNGAIAYAPSVNKVYALGTANGNAGDNGVYGDFTYNLTAAGNDAVMLELNPGTGHIDNATFYSSTAGNDNIYGACYDSATRDIFITGSFETTLTLPGIGALPPSNGTNSALLVARYSTTAHNFVWAKSINATSQSGIRNAYRTITSDNRGHIYGGGSFYGTVTVGSETFTSAAICDILVTSFDAYSGDIRWSEHIDDGTGPGNNNVITGIAVDNKGKMAVGGFNTAPNVMFGAITLPYLNYYDNLFAFADVPMVKTAIGSDITTSSVTLSGEIINTGQNSVTARGILYGTDSALTIGAGTNLSLGSGTGTFSQAVTGLTANTKYYARSYMTTSRGTFYGTIEPFTTSAVPPPPACIDWSDITADLGITGNTRNTMDMASDTAGNLYVSYVDMADYKLRMKKYDGTGWHNVGGAITDTTYFYHSITVDRFGTPYAAIKEDGYEGETWLERIIVKKFNGTSWVTVGSTHYFTGTTEIGYMKIVTAPDGTPYISYPDDEHGNVPVIKKFNGTDWETIPFTASYTNPVLPIAVDAQGTLYAGYNNQVVKYNGSNWLGIADGLFASTGSVARDISFDPDGNPIVLYSSGSNMYVTKVNIVWTQLGAAVGAGAGYSDLLVDKTGNIFVSVRESSGGNGASVYTYSGGVWTPVIQQGISGGPVTGTFLASGSDNEPAITYIKSNAVYIEQLTRTNPTILPATGAVVTQGTVTAALSYTAATNNPVKYSILWDNNATAAGFTNVNDALLNPASITVSVPAAAAIDTYSAKLVVKNDEGCVSDTQSISISVISSNMIPEFVGGASVSLSVCRNSSYNNFNTALAIRDTNAGQSWLWRPVTLPQHGGLSFSASVISSDTTIMPTILVYNTNGDGYTGEDSFQVRVTDNLGGGDTIMVHVNVTAPVVTGVTDQVICKGNQSSAIIFTGTGSSYSWMNDNPSIGLMASGAGNIAVFTALNETSSPNVANVIVTPDPVAGCDGVPDTFKITVMPLPVISSGVSPSVCAGATSAVYTFTGVDIAAGGAHYTYNITWDATAVTAGLANVSAGALSDTVITISVPATMAPGTYNGSVTLNNGTCDGPSHAFTLTINTPPSVGSTGSQTLCSGNITDAVSFTGTAATYTWANNNTNIGLASSGAGNIAAFSAVNTGNTVQTATVTVTPANGSCYGTARTFTYTVKPTPTVNSITDQAACNGEPYTDVAFTGNIGLTAYTWSNSNSNIGLSNSGMGNIDGFNAVNTTAATQTSTITVTPSYDGCTGTPASFVLYAYPTPVVNATSDQVLCNNATTTHIQFSGPVASTAFGWQNSNTSIGLADNNTGDINAFTAVNTTTAPVSSTIVVTPYANGCAGQKDTFTITVNPTPMANGVSGQVKCNSDMTDAVNFSSPTSGTTYSWSNSNGSIGLAISGTGNIASFAATNSGSAIETATVTVTPRANACDGVPSAFVYTVNPTPGVNAIADQDLCNGFTTTPVSMTGAVSGTIFNWTNNNTLIGLASYGNTPYIPAFPAMNSSAGTQVSMVVITPVANGCTGMPDTFTYTVTPTPTVNAVSDQSLCNAASTTAVTFTGAVSSTVYNWSNSNSGIGLSTTGTGDIAAFMAANSDSHNDTAVITVTPAVGSCVGNMQSFMIIVKPTPDVDVVSNQVLCNNAATTAITFTGAVAGTTNNWTNDNASVGLAASGTGNIASFTAVNTGSAPVVAHLEVTPSAYGCVGTSRSFNITVNPIPQLSTLTSATVCSRSPFSYGPASLTAGTAYAWTRAAAAGISNAAGSGTGAVNEVLVNTTLAPKTVHYQYTLTANGCSNQQSLAVVVNPTPQAPVIAITCPAEVCSNVQFQNFGAAADAPDTVQYTWTATGAEIYAEGAGHRYALVSFPSSGAAGIILTSNVTGFSCTAGDTFAVNVNTSVTQGAEIYYVHDHFIYADNSVENYQWGYDDATTLDSTMYAGQVDQNFYEPAPDFAGKRYWVITGKGGCMAKTYYNKPTAVNQVGNAEVAGLKVFPNPASNSVAVEVSGISGGSASITLTDITGKVITTIAVVNNKALLDVSMLASGVYIVNCFRDNNKVCSTKVVKQ